MTLPLFPPEQGVSVWDTSAIIELRQNNITRDSRRLVLAALKGRSGAGRLFFPREVIHELKRFAPVAWGVQDELLAWAHSCEPAVTSVAVQLESVKQPSPSHDGVASAGSGG